MGTDCSAELCPHWRNMVLILSWTKLAKSVQHASLRGAWQYAAVDKITWLCLECTCSSAGAALRTLLQAWCPQAPMGIKVVLHVARLFDATLIFHLIFNYLMATKTKFLTPKSKPDLSSINSCGGGRSPTRNRSPGWLKRQRSTWWTKRHEPTMRWS